MKKLVSFAIALIIAVMTMSAQNSSAFKQGYHGVVSASGHVGVNKGVPNNCIELSTSHGYNFGDGVYMGGGVGLNIALNGNLSSIPIFYEMKYNIIDWKISPYVSCQIGTSILGLDGPNLAFLASPRVGVDYRKVSICAGYRCEAGEMNKFHAVSLSVAINF